MGMQTVASGGCGGCGSADGLAGRSGDVPVRKGPGARATFARGGIHPNERKELTQDAPIEDFRATSVTVHLSQNLGAPSVALVKKGALVRRGQLIASDSGGGMPMHAPISGIVRQVDKAPHPSQVVGEAIVIEAQEVPDGDLEFADDEQWASCDRDTILARIKAAGRAVPSGAEAANARNEMNGYCYKMTTAFGASPLSFVGSQNG